MSKQDEKIRLVISKVYDCSEEDSLLSRHVLEKKEINEPSTKWLMSLDYEKFDYVLRRANEAIEYLNNETEDETSKQQLDFFYAFLILMSHDHKIHFGETTNDLMLSDCQDKFSIFCVSVVSEALRRDGLVEFVEAKDWTVYDEKLKIRRIAKTDSWSDYE